MNINFTNCDIEKGYNIINVNDGLINFMGCYIEAATSMFHILLNNFLNYTEKKAVSFS